MSIPQDIRLALRLFRRSAYVTATIVVSIAFSVGASAVVFTAIKSVLIDPMPYARPSELMQVGTKFGDFDPAHPDFADFVFWNDAREIARRTRTLESLGVYSNALSNLAGDASTPPEALYGLRVSASVFPTLGVTPMLGRNILPEEDKSGHGEVMILSYGLWVRRFDADRSIVGRHITINGHDCRVIGVMPAEFNFPLRRSAVHTPAPYVEFWSALEAPGPVPPTAALGMVGRLRPGLSLAEAEHDIDSIGASLSREFPATNRDRTLRLGRLQDRQVGGARIALWFLMAAAMMFSLIGCANVANLLLARATVRQREIAIRIAIGAGRGRIIRQLLTESLVLAVSGGICGYLLAVAAWQILPAIAPANVPRLAGGHAGLAILGFALAIALVNGILFGIAPAFHAGNTRVVATNDFGSATTSVQGKGLRNALVIAEVAVTIVLAMVGAQVTGTFIQLLGTDPGFSADHILASVVIPASDRYKTAEDRALLYKKFLDALAILPGVESVGAVDALPFSGENHGGLITNRENDVMDPRHQLGAEINVVSSGYLETMGVRLEAGRWFSEEDMKDSSDTAIVNDIAASRLWPGTDAVGQRVCVFCSPENPNNWKRVIGVVSTVQHAAMDRAPGANVYLASGALERAVFLVARSDRPSKELGTAIRRAIAGVDPNQPVFLSVSLRTLIADSLADRRFIMILLVATSFLALVMAVAGVYGVTAYAASRQTHEIGVRMALGATRHHILGLVFRQGFFTALTGLMLGLGITVVLVRVLRGAVSGLESETSLYGMLAAVLVGVAAAVACLLPARRASSLEPLDALRED